MSRVFISHSSKDQKVARTICSALEARGLRCWLASRDVAPGENFQEAIARAIRTAKAMVLVFTKNANDSAEIKKEIALASQNQLVVIPVRIEDVLPNDALAYELVTRQWIDCFQDWENAIERLTARIGAVVEINPTSIPSPMHGGVAAASGDPRPAFAGAEPIAPAALVILSLNGHLLAAFLLNIAVFAGALMIVFVQRSNYALAFGAFVVMFPLAVVGQRTMDREESVRLIGIVIGVVGMIAVGAAVTVPQFWHVSLLESSSVQNGMMLMGIYFIAAISFYGSEWKKLRDRSRALTPWHHKSMKFYSNRWIGGFTFLSSLLFILPTATVLHQITESALAVLPMLAIQLAIIAYCFRRFRRDVVAAALEAAPVAPM